MSVTLGADQTATAGSPLPQPIRVQAVQAYTNAPYPGITIAFTDGNKGGVFNPASAIADENGLASTTYTLPKKVGTYILSASASGFGDLDFAATGVPGPPVRMVSAGGPGQTAPAGTVLPGLLGVTVLDANKNGVSGVTVTFSDGGKGGVLTPPTLATDAFGKARVSYQLPNLPGKVLVTASSVGFTTLKYGETAVVGPPANVAIVSGDNQSTGVNAPLPNPLVVKVTDQVGNAVSGAAVTFTAPSGTFSSNPVTTDAGGSASVTYTAGTDVGDVIITATSGTGSAQFHETVQ